MCSGSKPPIWRDANRLLVEIEQAVRCFPRYHKYATGGEFRRQVMHLCQSVSRALSATGDARLLQVRKLLDAVDDLKITIQLAKALQAFASFAAFQRIAELAVEIGKQGGAWMRHLSSAKVRPESRNQSAGQGTFNARLNEASAAGYFLQLDIKNFFNSVDRPVLFKLVPATFPGCAHPHSARQSNRYLQSREESLLQVLELGGRTAVSGRTNYGTRARLFERRPEKARTGQGDV